MKGVDCDIDCAGIFDTNNAVNENPDHIDLRLLMPVLPPVADAGLVFDEDCDTAFDGQLYDIIPSASSSIRTSLKMFSLSQRANANATNNWKCTSLATSLYEISSYGVLHAVPSLSF